MKKKRKYKKSSLHPLKLYTLPLSKKSYTNSPPKYKTTLKPKTTSPFCHELQRASHWEIVISSSPEESASSSSLGEASREGEGEGVRPAMRAC